MSRVAHFGPVPFLLLAVASCILPVSSAFGQAVEVASVSGVVTDPTGTAVPNATVIITETDKHVVHTATSDATGHYVFNDLPVGPYRLEVKAPGFKNYVQSGIELQVGANATSNVTMQLGNVSETVEVTANAAMLETRESTVAQVISQKEVNDLPLNGRYVTQLVLLSGAAITVSPASGDLTGSKNFYSSTTISVAGGQANATNYLLDGGYNVDTFTNVNMPFPFPDALQEFSVETSSLPAQYGEHPGGVMNAVTKSGTNQFHGDLFEYLRNGDLNARGYFATARDTLKRNQWGGTLGGRIIKDKLFFFGGFQATPIRTNPPSTISYVPTAAVEAGDFSAIDGSSCQSNHKFKQLKNPFTNTNFGNDQIPVSMFDPAAVKMLQYLPATSDPCGKVTYGIPANTNEYETIGRVDWVINSKHTFFGRYFIDDYTLNASFLPNDALVTTNPGNAERAQTITLGDTYTFNATTLNSAHATFERRRDNRGPASTGISPASIGSNVFSQDPNFLELAVSGYFSTYCGTCNHAYFNTNTWSYTDDLTLIRGRHQFMFGADVIRTQMNANNNYELDGDYQFTQALSGDNLADFMLGDLSAYSQSRVQATANRQTDPGIYAQDTWRVRDNFTVTAGVRWEPMLFPQDVYGRGSTFNTADFLNNVHSTVYPGAPAGMLYYGDPGIPKAFVNDKWMNFAPRLGLVYAPKGGHDTFRLGGAILYDTAEMFFDERVQSNPPFVDEVDESWTLNSKGVLPTGANGYGTLTNPWISYPGGNPFPITTAYFPSSGALYVTMPLNLKPTYITNWNASYQHQFANSWLATISYLGNKTTHIWVGQETNPAVYIPGSSASTQSRRVLTLLNPTQGLPIGSHPIADDGGNANYQGMIASLQHRFSHNYTVLANYTWSHCTSEAEFTGEIAGPVFEDPYNLGLDRGPCDMDVRQILNASFVAISPHIGGPFWGKILGNWQLAPIVEAHSGLPINITSGVDNSKTGVGLDRPNVVNPGVSVVNSNWGPNLPQYLDPAALAQNATGTFGDLGRNAVDGPGTLEFDASLSRIFQINERWRLEARCDGFNVINHTNFGNPTLGLNSSTFGRITSTQSTGPGQLGTNRILQFAMKLYF
ncbi:MAG TPA: TonB-dependent receptor [Bryobacteraceae bacterium]|nr:TonB-dependent receptor [Bryobacteraceae bacterium]